MNIYLYSRYFGRFAGGSKSSVTTFNYLSKNNKIKQFSSISNLESSIKSKKPDVILHHNIHDMFKVYKLSKKYNIPLIITVNNLISCTSGTHIIQNKFGRPYFKSSFYRSFLALYKEKYVRPFHEKIFAYLSLPSRYRLMKKRINILNDVAGVIATGKTLKKLLQINGVKNKIYICPQPIDDSFLKNKLKRKNNQILFMSGAEPFKGIHVLIEAFQKLNRKDITLLIAGKIRKANKINKRKYPKNIKFLGKLEEDQLKKLYQTSTFLAFPNLWFEAFGRGWAEAITSGCPVLTFKNRAGPSDYLDSKTALFAETNIDDLKKKIDLMLSNKNLRVKLSKNSSNFAKNDLIASSVQKKLQNIYRQILR